MRSILYSNLLLLLLSLPQACADDHSPKEISVPKKLLKTLKSFEPSGALYLQEQDSYLIASDDTTEADGAMLFLMSAEGVVQKNPVTFDAIETMTDIESLSSENGYMYALSSQSRNKKGKVLKERNLFARGKFENGKINESEAIELRPALLRAIKQSSEPQLKNMRAKFDELLEIEASFVREGNLFVGLKDPQPRPGVALLLDLGSVEKIFHEGKIEKNALKVASEIDFGNDHKLSEILVANEGLLLASTSENGGGALWSYENSQLRELRKYAEIPEGMAWGRDGREILVVFDQGKGKALFTHARF